MSDRALSEQWRARAWQLRTDAAASDAQTGGSTMQSDWTRLGASLAELLAQIAQAAERAALFVLRRR